MLAEFFLDPYPLKENFTYLTRIITQGHNLSHSQFKMLRNISVLEEYRKPLIVELLKAMNEGEREYGLE